MYVVHVSSCLFDYKDPALLNLLDFECFPISDMSYCRGHRGHRWDGLEQERALITFLRLSFPWPRRWAELLPIDTGSTLNLKLMWNFDFPGLPMLLLHCAIPARCHIHGFSLFESCPLSRRRLFLHIVLSEMQLWPLINVKLMCRRMFKCKVQSVASFMVPSVF